MNYELFQKVNAGHGDYGSCHKRIGGAVKATRKDAIRYAESAAGVLRSNILIFTAGKTLGKFIAEIQFKP